MIVIEECPVEISGCRVVTPNVAVLPFTLCAAAVAVQSVLCLYGRVHGGIVYRLVRCFEVNIRHIVDKTHNTPQRGEIGRILTRLE